MSDSTVGEPTIIGNAGGREYEIIFTVSTILTVSTCSYATFDTYLYVTDGADIVQCSNDDFCSTKSQINACELSAGLYKIIVTGFGAEGDFTLRVICGTYHITILEKNSHKL